MIIVNNVDEMDWIDWDRTIEMGHPDIQRAINLLKGLDGETMQYVITQLGHEEQMLKQLMLSSPINDVKQYYDLRLDHEYGFDIMPD